MESLANTNLEKGVIYMATLNKDEPACSVMLGMLAVKNQDKNLTMAAFRKAISLGSIQAPILRSEISQLEQHISEAQHQKTAIRGGATIVSVLFLCVCA